MKENDFKDIISKLNIDNSMNQRITEHLLNNEKCTSSNNQRKWRANLFVFNNKKSFFRAASKVAIAIAVLAVVGTATAWAASYFMKSYPVEIQVKTEEELGITRNEDGDLNLGFDYRTAPIQRFGKGHKLRGEGLLDASRKAKYENSRYIEELGITLPSPYGPEDPNPHESDIKSGDEVFAVLGLPNLVPTYLFENYLLEDGGYRYKEPRLDANTSYKQISAGFYSSTYYTDNTPTPKYVYFDFIPSETSTKDALITYADNASTVSQYIITTYVTKGGLICNLVQKPDDDGITANINYDSETLGNASYMLSFSNIEMDEVEAILDSLPITTEAAELDAQE